MNQDSNNYYPPTSPGYYPQYNTKQTGPTEPYPSQVNDFSQYPPQMNKRELPPPYAHPNTTDNYQPNPNGFQIPPPLPPPPPPPLSSHESFPNDVTQGQNAWGKFTGLESKNIRRAFIRKVYVILMFQLAMTFGIIAAFHFTPAVRSYIKSSRGQWLYWTSYVVFLVTYITIACCKNVGRRFPLNMILLTILTLSMSYMMGMISAYFNIESVLIAVGITSFVCLGVTLFSFQTKFDFTSCTGVLFAISLALFGFGIVCIFTYSRILYTIYAGLGAVAFSIFLAVDTQLIMGGKRHEISAEDHIFASLMLYLDVVYIFMYILMLVGKRE